MGNMYEDDMWGDHESPMGDQPRPGSLNTLESFGTDLTELAANDLLDPVIGREEEIRRSIQILGRRKKNNPVLVGEPGVGKCVTKNTLIEIRNKKTGKIESVTIGNFLKMINK